MIDIAYNNDVKYNQRKGDDIMAHTTQVNFRIDEDVKRSAEKVLDEIGLSMSAAITVFLKKVSREHRIPFEVSADPFMSESNIEHLRRGVAALNEGKGVEHDIIEEDD